MLSLTGAILSCVTALVFIYLCYIQQTAVDRPHRNHTSPSATGAHSGT